MSHRNALVEAGVSPWLGDVSDYRRACSIERPWLAQLRLAAGWTQVPALREAHAMIKQAPASHRRGKTAGVSFRMARTPKPYLQLTAGNESRDAAVIAWRLDEIWRSRGCAAEIFIDDLRRCYVVSCETVAALRWVVDHEAWWCGTFRAGCDVDVIADEIARSAR
jgi:hypothetical protein